MGQKVEVRKLLDGYKKFIFPDSEKAYEAKKELEKKYPTMIIKVSSFGSLFCKTHNQKYESQIISDVLDLGGKNP